MNPTLLGEDFVRETLDAMGYNYIALNGHHFINDLQFGDGIAMLKRLKAVGKELNLEVGVKLTNTLPVKIQNQELPGEEMYMSGRSLYALSISLAGRLAKEFDGDLQISYSGGIDFFNVDRVLSVGIQPVTFATTILKPGGYERITQMAKKVEGQLKGAFAGIDLAKIESLAKDALSNKHHLKELRPVNGRKLSSKLPIFDCAIAPCTIGCPINQQIPQYVALVGEEKYDEAFELIVNDNASPAITGSICDHQCQYKCTRLDYDESVLIRDMKKIAVLKAQDKYVEKTKPADIRSRKKVAVVGAGAAGLATALFLRRNGIEVTVMDKKDRPYGIVEYVIPEFRIQNEMVRKDLELVKSQGVEFKLGIDEKFNVNDLKKAYDYVVVAIGAWKPGKISLEEGAENTVNAIAFLENYKADKGNVSLGKHVCVIGGGNVAMDAARAAKRTPGVESVSIVYRRTRQFMPADSEEIQLALTEGILFKELLSPSAYKDGKLVCEEMVLGNTDATGRRKPVSTGNKLTLDADAVIIAVGEQIDSSLLKENGIELDPKGFPIISPACETNISGVYVAGDVKFGPGTIVKAIADGKAVAKDILAKEGLNADFEKKVLTVNEEALYEKKGILKDPIFSEKESERCLSCENICELCVDVCPNRANAVIYVDGGFASTHQIIHLDGMCNECGNCGIFCPHEGNPYKDKVTVFWKEEDFADSTNKGFIVIDKEKGICKVRTEDSKIVNYTVGQGNVVSKEMADIIMNCINKYSYMI
jgi:putative selenate reductase